MHGNDYYAILCVSREDSYATITASFRAKAKVVHPDVNISKNASAHMAILLEAYQTLRDSVLREAYDRSLDHERHMIDMTVTYGFGNDVSEYTMADMYRHRAVVNQYKPFLFLGYLLSLFFIFSFVCMHMQSETTTLQKNVSAVTGAREIHDQQLVYGESDPKSAIACESVQAKQLFANEGECQISNSVRQAVFALLGK